MENFFCFVFQCRPATRFDLNSFALHTTQLLSNIFNLASNSNKVPTSVCDANWILSFWGGCRCSGWRWHGQCSCTQPKHSVKSSYTFFNKASIIFRLVKFWAFKVFIDFFKLFITLNQNHWSSHFWVILQKYLTAAWKTRKNINVGWWNKFLFLFSHSQVWYISSFIKCSFENR